MSLSVRIATHLPFLRRYARAATGSQTSGDAYVAAALETLISDVSAFPEASSDRIALFKLFSKLFGSTAVDIPDVESPFAWEKRAAANLQIISPLARQAFLLVAIEGFNALAPGGPIARPDLIIVARGGGSVEDLFSMKHPRRYPGRFPPTS